MFDFSPKVSSHCLPEMNSCELVYGVFDFLFTPAVKFFTLLEMQIWSPSAYLSLSLTNQIAHFLYYD